jgi:hypothetical protein
MEVVARLQTIDTQRKARLEFIVKWAVGAARTLKDAFDEYVNKEVIEMKEILTMLASVGQDVEEDREKLRQTENEYLRVNDELNDVIDSANRNKIKGIDFTKPERPQQGYPYPPQRVQSPPRMETESSEVEELDILTIIEAFSIIGDVDEMRQRIDRHARNYTRSVGDIASIFDELLRRRGLAGGS